MAQPEVVNPKSVYVMMKESMASGADEQILIFYAQRKHCNQTHCRCRELQAQVEDMFTKTEVYRSIRTIEARLRQSAYDVLGLVIVAADEEDMLEIIRAEDLLEGSPVFLVLPALNERMRNLGHRLKPRFMMSMNDDAAHLITALSNALRRHHAPGHVVR